MIPAPDAFRCEATHPEGHGRCFKAAHGDEECHSLEVKNVLFLHSEVYTVFQWGLRDLDHWMEGPFHDVPAIHRAADYRDP